MMFKKILFVSHHQSQCGVYEFGKNITTLLKDSHRYNLIRVECSSLLDLKNAISKNSPDAIIYNYMPSVMPWVATKIGPRLFRNNIAHIQIPQIGIIHDVTQQVADSATSYRNKYVFNRGPVLINSLFDYYIAPDPTLLLQNPIVFKTGRLVPAYRNEFEPPSTTVVGSFGFGTPNKGFEKIVRLVQEEFDKAIIRFNIPAATFGDQDGVNARTIAAACKAMIRKPGIHLTVTHDFLEIKPLLDFLGQNSINVFLYEDHNNRGLSSAIDNAMAVRRPIAVSDSVMFRHLFDVEPSIRVERNNLKTIIRNGFLPLQKHFENWNAENQLWEYERILDSIFSKRQLPFIHKSGMISTFKTECFRLLSKPRKNFTWLQNSDQSGEEDTRIDRSVNYRPLRIPSGISLNRILDDDARKLYASATNTIALLVPKTFSRKIPRANVQQAFVFDTVVRYLSDFKNPKVLCVGSHEDTASMSLRRMGFKIEEIDPRLNYSLQEYFTKPTTVKESYHIIFSTSVIEHDSDDETFMKCISELLAPGGVAVITCDYKEGWRPGDPRPECNMRFYTQQDLRDRLLPLMNNCHLVDDPQWDCPNPDFNFLGRYQYTFATFVLKKA